MANDMRSTTATSRRTFLRLAGLASGGALLGPSALASAEASELQAAAPSPLTPSNQLTVRRAALGALPIQRTPLGTNIFMLSGPGGNVVVQHGADGKLVVDSFVSLAWVRLKATLDGLEGGPLTWLVDTHWHFDHVDNNARFRSSGANVVAHANTKQRLSESHDLLGMHFDAAPVGALPTVIFTDTWTLRLNGEDLLLGYFGPAHTDTDIYVRYPAANVMHMGDVYFNGRYPFIDAGTGGNINGMIAAVTKAIEMVDATTKIVPGHGPVGDKASLTKYRDMLAGVRERVQTLKTGGRSLAEVQQAKPSAEFDAEWGAGGMAPEAFVALVYNTLQ
jgi:glyoxylase-like metal-dependent hydrolase (beta-lactamase superfamily II)